MKYNNFTFKNNKLLCWRLGPINSQKQKHFNKDIEYLGMKGTHKPPCSRGIWAFPYPHYDFFFCYHQYKKYLPKIFKNTAETEIFEDEKNIEIYNQLMKNIRKEHRGSLFYTGQFYSHIFPDGEISCANWYFWDNVRQWSKIAQQTLFEYYKSDVGLWKIKNSVDHLELFIEKI